MPRRLGMKRLWFWSIVAVAMAICGTVACEASTVPVATGAAGVQADSRQGCTPVGSWYGYDAVPTVPTWMSTISGQSASSGTMILDLFAFDGTLGGTFPNVVKTTQLKGIWERIEGNAIRVTVLGASLDAAGSAVTLGRYDAIDRLSDDCNTVTVGNGVLHVFLASQNPFTDEPLFSIPTPEHDGYRMRFQ